MDLRTTSLATFRDAPNRDAHSMELPTGTLWMMGTPLDVDEDSRTRREPRRRASGTLNAVMNPLP